MLIEERQKLLSVVVVRCFSIFWQKILDRYSQVYILESCLFEIAFENWLPDCICKVYTLPTRCPLMHRVLQVVYGCNHKHYLEF